MPRAKKSTFTADMKKLLDILWFSPLGSCFLVLLLTVLGIGLLILLTGNNYHAFYLICGIVTVVIILFSWLRFFMRQRK